MSEIQVKMIEIQFKIIALQVKIIEIRFNPLLRTGHYCVRMTKILILK